MSELVEKAKDVLGKRIGPLPLGAWVVGVGGGIAVAVWVRGRALDQEYAEATAPEYVEEDTTGWDTPDPGGTTPGVGGGAVPDNDGSYPESPPEPDEPDEAPGGNGAAAKARRAKTNAAWKKWAVLAMTRRGFATSLVDNVLRKYLAGEKLTTAQAAVLGATMGVCGPPPRKPPKAPAPGNGNGGGGNGGHGNGGVNHTGSGPTTGGIKNPPGQTKDHGHGHHHPGHTGPYNHPHTKHHRKA